VQEHYIEIVLMNENNCFLIETPYKTYNHKCYIRIHNEISFTT